MVLLVFWGVLIIGVGIFLVGGGCCLRGCSYIVCQFLGGVWWGYEGFLLRGRGVVFGDGSGPIGLVRLVGWEQGVVS